MRRRFLAPGSGIAEVDTSGGGTGLGKRQGVWKTSPNPLTCDIKLSHKYTLSHENFDT